MGLFERHSFYIVLNSIVKLKMRAKVQDCNESRSDTNLLVTLKITDERFHGKFTRLAFAESTFIKSVMSKGATRYLSPTLPPAKCFSGLFYTPYTCILSTASEVIRNTSPVPVPQVYTF